MGGQVFSNQTVNVGLVCVGIFGRQQDGAARETGFERVQ